MIKSFRHEGLAELFAAGSTRKVQPKRANQLRLI
jgi:plasmid maintenance system killer protein